MLSRVAAILVGIDANELNNVFVCRHFIMLKIAKIGGFLGCSEHAFEHTFVTPNARSVSQMRARSAKFHRHRRPMITFDIQRAGSCFLVDWIVLAH